MDELMDMKAYKIAGVTPGDIVHVRDAVGHHVGLVIPPPGPTDDAEGDHINGNLGDLMIYFTLTWTSAKRLAPGGIWYCEPDEINPGPPVAGAQQPAPAATDKSCPKCPGKGQYINGAFKCEECWHVWH